LLAALRKSIYAAIPHAKCSGIKIISLQKFYAFMHNAQNSAIPKISLLERFGIYYLNFFNKIDRDKSIIIYSDEVIQQKIKRIIVKGVLLACIVGVVCVFPTIWVDVRLEQESFIKHYGIVALVTIISIVIEIYLLFLIALKAVYEVSEIIHLQTTEKELTLDGLFGVKNILARTALELPDPEMEILGIDPFKRISKKNLLVLSLIYKAKIFVTNVVVKYLLLYLVGKTIFGVSILYEALLVECFWNAVVIWRVVKEARLRLFGFALANQITKNLAASNLVQQLSTEGKIGCLRAVGNAVVMAQNYHPNMVVLLLSFQQILKIKTAEKLDDWDLFLQTLHDLPEQEQNFLMDVFTVSAAFDGKISALEAENFKTVYREKFDLYFPRIKQLTQYLEEGMLNKALALSHLDFEAG
jgi:hypothetical protein